MRAVVVANGDVDASDVAHARAADLLIAADGGSAHLTAWGLTPQLVVGDLDSLAPDAPARPAAGRVERHDRDKDQTDTELAIERAVASGADHVVVLGALGGPRIDHAIANVLLLASPRRVPVRLVRGPLSIRALRAGERALLGGGPGDLVTLLAVGGDAGEVRTGGLRYPLEGETLHLGSSRGVSNVITSGGAHVSVGSGTLLIVESGPLGTQPQPKA